MMRLSTMDLDNILRDTVYSTPSVYFELFHDPESAERVMPVWCTSSI